MLKYWILLFSLHSLFASLRTLHVELSTDNDPGGIGDVGDLRYCLNLMNQDLNTTAQDYAIVFAFPMTIQLNGILPIINNSPNPVNITIGNSGSIPTVVIDGNINGNNGAYSGFFIPMGNVTIQNITFQNLIAKGGDGGNGISDGGGGLGAGGAIYVPTSFLNGSHPSVTLINVSITNCSAVGGNGGNYLVDFSTGNEGGGGGGGFSGNGGSITTVGSTGGGGGGGFGGDGGAATTSADQPEGGGGGGGGGLGSRATLGTPENLGTGGSDQENGSPGNGYGLLTTAGSGGGGNTGGIRAGGGGGGNGLLPGGGGGGSAGLDGTSPQEVISPGGVAIASGGNGGDGGGGGGGGVVKEPATNNVDGAAGTGGYGGGGGGGAGTGAYDVFSTVKGGLGGLGGGGGGGGVDSSGTTLASGGDSGGGGGGGGGGPSNGSSTSGGVDIGSLGGGAGGDGANTVGPSSGGGGGGGGSGLGGAIFVDSHLNFTVRAFSGIPTIFNTTSNTTQEGMGGTGSPDGTNGQSGSALGNSIFLRSNSSLTFLANDTDDLLTLGEGVSFVDDTIFGAGATSVNVKGNGTVIYNGTSNYLGNITINNANFKVNGQIDEASISVSRDINFSLQRGTLSGAGILTGNVIVDSGIISPDAGETLTLGNLVLSASSDSTLGSLVHIEIDSDGTSLVSISRSASLAGILEINLDSSAIPGTYTILTSSGITGTFDSVEFTGVIPSSYSISYLPIEAPTYVLFDFSITPPPPPSILKPPSNLRGEQKKNNFGLEYELYNQLKWTPSPSTEIIGYFIYRDGKKIATVNAASQTYKDHNRKKGLAYLYAITGFNSANSESSAISITITP